MREEKEKNRIITERTKKIGVFDSGIGGATVLTELVKVLPNEDYIQGLIRIYNDDICLVIDDYNNSAYYEPSYVIARAYKNGEF